MPPHPDSHPSPITHQPFRILPSAFLLLSALPSPSPAQDDAPRRPNIVFILTDDQRWDQLSCAGHPYLRTPEIDRLAAEGARFANAFTTTSLCSPSRASFLSGLYASTHGVVNNFTDYPRDLDSFPRRLQESGYHTAYIGKWHMGEDDDSPRPGFDHWISHRGQGDYYDTEFNVDGERRVLPGYYTTVVTDEAIDWIRSDHGDRPFLLILGHKAPHTPYTPEPRYQHAFDHIPVHYPRSAFDLDGKPDWVRQRLDTWHGIYGPLYGYRDEFPDRSAAAVLDFERFLRSLNATLLSVDDSVGRVRRALDDLGVLDDTLIVYAGDNGSLYGEHGMTDKRTMHEPSIRIPLIARYPRLIRPGTVVPEQVLNLDLAPTLVQAAGAPALENIHGRSWLPLLQGTDDGWRTSWFYEYNYEEQFPYTPNVRGVRTDRWKFVRYPHGDGTPDRHTSELYDLVSDPGELHNLIDDPHLSPVADSLRSELDRLISEAGGVSYQRMPLDQGIKQALPAAEIR